MDRKPPPHLTNSVLLFCSFIAVCQVKIGDNTSLLTSQMSAVVVLKNKTIWWTPWTFYNLYAGIILGMTKNDFDPIKNGLVLWNPMALAAALYGTEVIHFKRQDIKELESIQANFLAHLLGQRTSVSHVSVREEVGVKPFEQILMDMKLNYWYHLTRSIEGS